MSTAEFERIVRLWQRRLGLERWDITVDFDTEAADSAFATTVRSNAYDTATITLEKAWPTWADEKGLEFVEKTIVHELLHLLARDVDRVFESLNGQLHRDAHILTERRYDHEIEGLVDRLSYRFVEIAGTTGV